MERALSEKRVRFEVGEQRLRARTAVNGPKAPSWLQLPVLVSMKPVLDVGGAVSLVLLVCDSSCRGRDASEDHGSAVACGRQRAAQTQTRAGRGKTFAVCLAALSQV